MSNTSDQNKWHNFNIFPRCDSNIKQMGMCIYSLCLASPNSSSPLGLCCPRRSTRASRVSWLHVHRSGHHLWTRRQSGRQKRLHHPDPHSDHAQRWWEHTACNKSCHSSEPEAYYSFFYLCVFCVWSSQSPTLYDNSLSLNELICPRGDWINGGGI